jgi:peptide/nickel transport system substrate-binding protein
MYEYRTGQADSISGMVLSNNNRTLRIYYVDPLPPAALFAGGVWLNPVPRHWITPVIEEVGHEGIEGHMRARDQLLGFGPFIIETVVPGESVLYRANDDFFRGAPLVDGVLVELLPFEMVPAAMRAGDFDIAAYQTANLAEFNLMSPTNYQLYGWYSNSTSFINFRLGGMGREQIGEDEYGEPIYSNTSVFLRDDDHPITNIAIRRALAHAVDRQTVSDVVGQGLWTPARSVLHPFNASQFIDQSLEGFVFDLELSNRILDEAGFTERDSDGYRLNLNGEPMTFIYGQHSNPTHIVLVPLNIQNWREIGLRVEMFEGDFADWGLFTDIVVGNEVGPIDIFAMGWSLGNNPAPHTLWANNALFNMPRYTSPTFEAILDDIVSAEAWDDAFLAAAYSRWERAFYDELPAMPLTWNWDLVAVNNRVANYSRVRVDTGYNVPGNMQTNSWGNHLIGLTAPRPYSND